MANGEFLANERLILEVFRLMRHQPDPKAMVTMTAHWISGSWEFGVHPFKPDAPGSDEKFSTLCQALKLCDPLLSRIVNRFSCASFEAFRSALINRVGVHVNHYLRKDDHEEELPHGMYTQWSSRALTVEIVRYAFDRLDTVDQLDTLVWMNLKNQQFLGSRLQPEVVDLNAPEPDADDVFLQQFRTVSPKEWQVLAGLQGEQKKVFLKYACFLAPRLNLFLAPLQYFEEPQPLAYQDQSTGFDTEDQTSVAHFLTVCLFPYTKASAEQREAFIRVVPLATAEYGQAINEYLAGNDGMVCLLRCLERLRTLCHDLPAQPKGIGGLDDVMTHLSEFVAEQALKTLTPAQRETLQTMLDKPSSLSETAFAWPLLHELTTGTSYLKIELTAAQKANVIPGKQDSTENLLILNAFIGAIWKYLALVNDRRLSETLKLKEIVQLGCQKQAINLLESHLKVIRERFPSTTE